MRAMQDLSKGSKLSHHHEKRWLFSSPLLVFPFVFRGCLVFLGLTGGLAPQHISGEICIHRDLAWLREPKVKATWQRGELPAN